MSKYKGLKGNLLRVNLSTRKVTTEGIQDQLWEKFLGGRGLGAYFLAKEVIPGINPLDPDNKLIFMNGPLAGTIIPGNNKICVTFKSPLTNTYSYSLCGGHWGPELKFAGYDGLIIEGRSEEPCYLWIDDDIVKIKPANHIWEKLIKESETQIRTELGGDNTIQIAVIGPAGEKLVNFATITAGLYREFGRGGSGAVMGSKNLKGIALRGSKDVEVTNPKKIISLSQRLIQNLRNSSGGKIRRQYGTIELVERINNAGFWVTKNFTEGYFKEGYNFEGKSFREKIVSGDSSCFGCPIGCGKWTYLDLQNQRQIYMEGPEFETIGMLGSNVGIGDWETLLKATEICDTYGFDTINAGAAISMLMEAYEKGNLSKDKIDGIDLNFGNAAGLLQILEKIGQRDGIGDILAKGVKEAAEILGITEYAIHSKGQSFPVYDPRGAKAMALTYATSPKGAHHMLATTFGAELAMGNRFEEKGKAELERSHQFSMAIVDSIALCSTMRAGIPLNDQIEAYNTATGMNLTIGLINKVAERIINLERMFNVKLGLDRTNDTLPSRFINESLQYGESKGQKVNLEFLLDQYYLAMGWTNDGIPSDEKLKELNLTEIFEF